MPSCISFCRNKNIHCISEKLTFPLLTGSVNEEHEIETIMNVIKYSSPQT